MEILYKKDATSSVMIVKNQAMEIDNYEVQMVINNEVEGLVPMSIKTVNNGDEIYYRITSMISLENIFAAKKISKQELCFLIRDIEILVEKSKEYLLDINDIAFSPEFIYIKKQTGKHYFCYIPQSRENFQEGVRKLFEKILEYIDYEDKTAILIAYNIQRITTDSDFTIADLVECVKENIEKPVADELDGEIEEKNQIEQYVPVEEDIGWLKGLSNIFRRRNKYKNEDELTGSVEYREHIINGSSEVKVEKYNPNDCETTLLAEEQSMMSISLKSIDLQKTMDITLFSFPCIIGKSRKNCDVIINDSVVSRVHAKILEDKKGYIIEDLNSTNGTYINGVRLIPKNPTRINFGDKITLANLDFIVE